MPEPGVAFDPDPPFGGFQGPIRGFAVTGGHGGLLKGVGRRTGFFHLFPANIEMGLFKEHPALREPAHFILQIEFSLLGVQHIPFPVHGHVAFEVHPSVVPGIAGIIRLQGIPLLTQMHIPPGVNNLFLLQHFELVGLQMPGQILLDVRKRQLLGIALGRAQAESEDPKNNNPDQNRVCMHGQHQGVIGLRHVSRSRNSPERR